MIQNGCIVIVGTKDFAQDMKPQTPYKRRGVDQLSDGELSGKLCGAHSKGCAKCECFDACQYGMEWERRKRRADFSADRRFAGGAVRGAGD